jgi:thioredoxin reductase (NADPH)
MAQESHYDVIILGAGPAGLQAAIHAARRKVSTLVLGRIQRSSLYKAHVENFCCIHGGSGEEMLSQARQKAQEAGAALSDLDITECVQEGDSLIVDTEDGERITCKALILAMGISRNRLQVKGEKEFMGRGISYCVDCDAGFYRDEAVAVIGCESAAASGALTLLFYASEAHLVCREFQVSALMEEKLRESQIQIHEGRTPVEILGNDSVTGILLDDGSSLAVSGVFVELGAKGAIELAGKLGVNLDRETMKYIAVDRKQATNVPGVFAAGDICGPPWQVAKAVGEGCVAGLEAAAYAKKLKKG